MRIRLAAIIGLSILLLTLLPAQEGAAADQCRPKEGESVVVWHHAIKPGHLEQAKDYFLKTLIPRLQTDNQIRDNYFLVNQKGTEIISFSFYCANDAKALPHEGSVVQGMKKHSTRHYRQFVYKIVLLNDEGLAGRRVAIEVNGEIVPRSLHDTHQLQDGDVVEIVHALGGG